MSKIMLAFVAITFLIACVAFILALVETVASDGTTTSGSEGAVVQASGLEANNDLVLEADAGFVSIKADGALVIKAGRDSTQYASKEHMFFGGNVVVDGGGITAPNTNTEVLRIAVADNPARRLRGSAAAGVGASDGVVTLTSEGVQSTGDFTLQVADTKKTQLTIGNKVKMQVTSAATTYTNDNHTFKGGVTLETLRASSSVDTPLLKSSSDSGSLQLLANTNLQLAVANISVVQATNGQTTYTNSKHEFNGGPVTAAMGLQAQSLTALEGTLTLGSTTQVALKVANVEKITAAPTETEYTNPSHSFKHGTSNEDASVQIRGHCTVSDSISPNLIKIDPSEPIPTIGVVGPAGLGLAINDMVKIAIGDIETTYRNISHEFSGTVTMSQGLRTPAIQAPNSLPLYLDSANGVEITVNEERRIYTSPEFSHFTNAKHMFKHPSNTGTDVNISGTLTMQNDARTSVLLIGNDSITALAAPNLALNVGGGIEKIGLSDISSTYTNTTHVFKHPTSNIGTDVNISGTLSVGNENVSLMIDSASITAPVGQSLALTVGANGKIGLYAQRSTYANDRHTFYDNTPYSADPQVTQRLDIENNRVALGGWQSPFARGTPLPTKKQVNEGGLIFSQSSGDSLLAFDYSSSTSWDSGANYDAAKGNYTGTVFTEGGYYGEWVQLKLDPLITAVQLRARADQTGYPSSFVLLGAVAVDGPFVPLHIERQCFPAASGGDTHYQIVAPSVELYQYYRLVVTSVTPDPSATTPIGASIAELRFVAQDANTPNIPAPSALVVGGFQQDCRPDVFAFMARDVNYNFVGTINFTPVAFQAPVNTSSLIVSPGLTSPNYFELNIGDNAGFYKIDLSIQGRVAADVAERSYGLWVGIQVVTSTTAPTDPRAFKTRLGMQSDGLWVTGSCQGIVRLRVGDGVRVVMGLDTYPAIVNPAFKGAQLTLVRLRETA